MSAAWLEDKVGELVHLTTMVQGGDPNIPTKGWAASGGQLVTEFKKVADEQLAERLEKALELRNDVVHGVFVGGEVFGPAESSETPTLATMKRQLGRSNPPQYSIKGWMDTGLATLASELSAIEELIDEEISYAMGLKVRPNPGANP